MASYSETARRDRNMRAFALLLLCCPCLRADDPEIFPIEDPAALRRNVGHIRAALEQWKTPLPKAKDDAKEDGEAIQKALDPHALLVVTINPEGRVKANRGLGTLALRRGEAGYALVKIVNQSGGKQRLKAKGEYTGAAESPFTLDWPDRADLKPDLSGELVEYRILKVQCKEAGKRELTISFEAGQGTQDLGFRGEVPVLFDVKEAK